MSFLRNTYYHLKPVLPLAIRLAARRRLARHIFGRSRDVWPIKRAARHQPPDWPGWPNGKKFAVVLTHDVEGRRGLLQSAQLAGLESSLGFRSSFNFIPEGEYSTPHSLRASLTEMGFEVGVHDLYHDGKLYRSHEEFKRHAHLINRYLHDWKCSGFRSGFMHHNLDWLHELDIEYDMSTFDTDPFEPQPDGVNTIFPFWVAKPVPIEQSSRFSLQSGSGYVELPYTLPQDSTLFFLLACQDITIWQRKLDWIAANGGMALVNVHPDYLNFDDQFTTRSFPARLYREFLEYISRNYLHEAWLALPRDVAHYCAQFRPEKPLTSGKRVCMISYSFYESDNRVMRYAEALTDRGDTVDVLALAKEKTTPRREIMEGVNVHRLQARQRNEKGKFVYLLRILRFLLHSSALLSWRHLIRRYDAVHVHNVPDFLVFAAWFPRLTGARVILDIHDILPEFFASKFGRQEENDWYFDRLLDLEHASCSFAHHVIIANHLWYNKITHRSVSSAKCSVVLNYVDSNLFFPRRRSRDDGKLIAIFPGGLQEHQGIDLAILAFARVVREFPNAEFHIYGDGNMKEPWVNLSTQLDLSRHIHFFDPLPIRDVVDKIANADVGLVPKRADSFGNEAYSTKIMEFMAMGLPVIAARTKIDQFYFSGDLVTFFESGNSEDLAAKILALFRDPSTADHQRSVGLAHVAANTWNLRKQEYFEIVDSLLPSGVSTQRKGSKECGNARADCQITGDPTVMVAANQVERF